jgi:UDP-glucuronate decarboxylase
MHPEDGRVVSNFIIAALKGEPLVIYGEGKQTRSFQVSSVVCPPFGVPLRA